MYKTRQTCLRTVRPNDKAFIINDGLVVATRAGFEVSEDCPKQYKEIICESIMNGWLIPVATVKDQELFWEELSK